MLQSLITIAGVVAIISYLILNLYTRYFKANKKIPSIPSSISSNDNKQPLLDLFEIIPLPDFDWKTTPPLKFRTFKPKYHLTMGLTNSNLSELIQMDSTYLDRITLRKQVIEDHHSVVIGSYPNSLPALQELYTWLTSTYLPTRFPTMFTLSPSSSPSTLLNLTTSTSLPLVPPSSPATILELLGQNLDEDFLILLPSEDGDGYTLKAYITCFPAGFDPSEKLGRKLRDIHGPVPGYKEKLERSMDKFFEKLEVGKVVKRSNWSITTHNRLFAASGNHLYEGETAEEETIDINNTFLRCERQLLHRLPNTEALVFSFKTYLYPIPEIKKEGLGKELAQAIDGLKEGNVPQMHFYKRGVVWGESVKGYLRS